MDLKASDTSAKSGVIGVITGFLILFVYIYNIPFAQVDIKVGDSSEFFDTVHSRNDDFKYVVGVYALGSYDDTNIFSINGKYKDYFDKICVAGGWDSKIPAVFAKYETLGVKNPIRELPERDDLLYAGSDYEADLLVQYFKEAYEEDVGYTVVETIGDVAVYKFKRN